MSEYVVVQLDLGNQGMVSYHEGIQVGLERDKLVVAQVDLVEVFQDLVYLVDQVQTYHPV